MWASRNLRKISRTGVNGSIQISTPIHCGMSKSSTPASSDSDGTGVLEPGFPLELPCGLNLSPYFDDIRQSATPYLRESNKFDTSVDQQFTNNMVAPPIFTELLCDKLSKMFCRYVYTYCRMKLTVDPVNIPGPQFVDLGLSNINALDK